VPTTILSAHRCHLGEGANYDAGRDTAWWFDILERRLFEAHLGNGIDYQQVIKGLVLLGAVCLDVYNQKR
jgi:sugar lactone lactonase YvrE